MINKKENIKIKLKIDFITFTLYIFFTCHEKI